MLAPHGPKSLKLSALSYMLPRTFSFPTRQTPNSQSCTKYLHAVSTGTSILLKFLHSSRISVQYDSRGLSR